MSSEITLTSLNKAFLTVFFTLFNNVKINLLIKQIVKHNNENTQTFKKLIKTYIFVIINYQMIIMTNKNFIQVAER